MERSKEREETRNAKIEQMFTDLAVMVDESVRVIALEREDPGLYSKKRMKSMC